MQAIESIADFWYTPKSEEGKENPTRFKLRGLTPIEFLELGEYITSDESGNVILHGRAIRKLLSYGLKGWENFRDNDGLVTFRRDSINANIDRIPFDALQEMGYKIFGASQLTAEDKKK